MGGLMFDYICDKQVNVNAYMAATHPLKKKKKNTTMKSLLLLI